MTIADLMDVMHVHDVNKDLETSEVKAAVEYIEAMELESWERMDREMRQLQPELYEV